MNHEERFIVFGFWSDQEETGSAPILVRSWERLNGRRQNGFKQAVEHLRLIRDEEYQLRVFRQNRKSVQNDDEASELASIEPTLIDAVPRSDGETIWADFNSADLGEPIDVATAKRRNPPWNRDELILALDLYLRFEGNPPGKNSSEVQELSELLNTMSSKLSNRGDDRFRNAAGVYMKMMNFRRLDDRFDGAGLKRGGKLEETIWREYADEPEKLERAIKQVMTLVDEGDELSVRDLDEIDQYEADESRVVMRVHCSEPIPWTTAG